MEPKKMELQDIPSDTVLSLSASIIISAPASHVFDIFTKPSTWPRWNSFCPSVDAKSPSTNEISEPTDNLGAVGTKMAVKVRMDPDYPDSIRIQNMVVTEFSKPEDDTPGSCYRIGWRAEGIPRLVLRADRTSECSTINNDEGESVCEFRTWEVMAGPAAYAVKYLYHSKLQARFEDTARDLKRYAEETFAARTS